MRPLAVALLLALPVLGLACGDAARQTDDGETFGAQTGGTTGGAGGASTGTGAGGGLGSTGCDPACTPPQVCSAARTCIDAGTCAVDGDCAKGEACDPASKTCKPGGGCGGQKLEAAPVAPNLLVVLDRSCSMTDKIGGVSKWKIAVAALDSLTTSYAGKVRFGLTLFPDHDGTKCEQGAIPIPVGDGNEPAIQALLAASLNGNDPNFPDGPCVTNIDSAMAQAATEPAFTDPSRDSFALLLTDGKQGSCGESGADAITLATIQGLLAKNVGTFVVGFGSGADPVALGQFAEAGGHPNPNDPAHKYYDASDAAALGAALDAIVKSTIGCKLALAEVPPDASEIYVFFDKQPVPRDPTHASGWDYDAALNQIVFYGASCAALEAGTVADVQVVFGCNQPLPG